MIFYDLLAADNSPIMPQKTVDNVIHNGAVLTKICGIMANISTT
ncbi:hypothetical protein GCWU000324_01541 [Kingella oralis ATCC 51147]|uniref:Uncharacterized protein n=1 Tax=Kingella oralis ATCC 51147 TaxID=629741 RepID=C4GKN6_9NEIS|nr:hypothetical protein GCWU000324_01541 [Kingella oralis ATCC 51147]